MSYNDKLTKKDYTNILRYYNQDIPDDIDDMKKRTGEILAEKLCSCIKKVNYKNEAASIAICTKNIFNKKGLKRGKFNCNEDRNVIFTKNAESLTIKQNKTRKNISVKKVKSASSRSPKKQNNNEGQDFNPQTSRWVKPCKSSYTRDANFKCRKNK